MKIADGMDDPGNDADDDDDVPDLVENFDECCKNEAKETIEKVEEVVEEVVATPAEGILLSNHYIICISLSPSPLFYATFLKRTLGYFLENLKSIFANEEMKKKTPSKVPYFSFCWAV